MDTELDSFLFRRNPYYPELNLAAGVLSIESYDKNNLVIGLNGGGIVFYNKANHKFHSLHRNEKNNPFSLPDDFVPSILKDDANRFWFGTENGGLTLLDPNFQKFQSFPLRMEGKMNNLSTCNTIFIDSDDNYWIGGENGWLETYTSDFELINSFEVKNQRVEGQGLFIKSINQDDEGQIIVATSIGGAYVLDDVNDTSPVLIPSKVSTWSKNDMFNTSKDNEGNIWISSHAGLLRYFDGKIRQVYHQDTSDALVEYLSKVVRVDNLIYTGFSSKGIGVLDLTTEEYTEHYTSSNSDLIDDFITDLFFDGDYFIWIGTQNGLQRFNIDTKEFQTYLIEDGLPSNSIYSINSADKYLWVGTSNGLARFDYETEKFHSYSVANGLPDPQFRLKASFKSSSGNLFFATNNGITYFNPNQITKNEHVGPLVFTAFHYKDSLYQYRPGGLIEKPINQVDTISLAYDHGLIAFEFALLNYTSPEKSSYAYRLRELDTTWYHLGNRRYVDFTRLPHGTYTFEVKAANHDGVWLETPRSITIIVSPPFWLTTWFMVLSSVAVLFLFWLILKLRTRNIAAKKKELEIEVENRTQEVRQKNHILEEKNEEITQSITYARRLQEAILPSNTMLQRAFTKHSMLYLPKDIVAGDFYWLEELEEEELICFAVADCTGHGVPGAMVSVVCSTALSRSVKEFGLRNANTILDKTRELVVETFEKSVINVKDGMDISLFVLNKKDNSLSWSGAHNPLWVLRKGEEKIEELSGDKQPVASFEHAKPFSETTLNVEQGDRLFLITDGYPDQFGNATEKRPDGKKFKKNQLKKLLISYNGSQIEQVNEKLTTEIRSWQGDLEQVDDICIMSIEF